MLQMRSARWYGRSTRAIIVLLLVVVSSLLPAMAQAASSSVNSYQYGYGYGWDDDADDGCIAHYFVYRGDTLSRIAARYGVSVYAIAGANGIHNINRIYPGQYLCIPDHGWHHDRYDDNYHRHHDANKGYGYKGYDDKDDYGYYGGYYGHKRYDDDGDHKHGYNKAAYGPVEKEYADPGYYRTSGGHTGVCYYPDPRYNAEDAEFYEDDERPDCS